MSLDFALKDMFRKKKITFSYIFMISLVIALSVFMIYFISSIGLNTFAPYNFVNRFYLSGGISIIYSDFSVLIIILICILTVVIVVIITSTLVITKRKDIAIMKSLGSLPGKLYGFYLTEAYLVFFIGLIIGLIIGLVSYGICGFLFMLIGFPVSFHIDFLYTPIIIICCVIGIFIIPGYLVRKMGRQKIMDGFSKDIPFNYDASKSLTFIPKWISSIGLHFKISVVNTIRRKGEFIRYLIVFSVILTIIMTLGIGTLVLRNSSEQWIHKSQGEDILVIGHVDVVNNYSSMYRMFSDPNLFIDSNDIDFLQSGYLFNFSRLESITNFSQIEKIDERLISFFDTDELDGYHYFEEGGYVIVGERRKGSFPIMGLNVSTMIQDFEKEGEYFTESNSYTNMFIGDGLAYNFFEMAFDQRMYIGDLDRNFHISAVVIDSFYSGFVGYIDSEIMRGDLNLTNKEINLMLLKLKPGTFHEIQDDLTTNITDNLGVNFTVVSLNSVFNDNVTFLSYLTVYPIILISLMGIISILSLYQYQKGGFLEKIRDFLIMRSIGAKNKLLRRILFLEASYVIIPSLMLSLGIAMILNSIVLFERVNLPHLSLPFIFSGIILVILLLFNGLSLYPIMKKLNAFSVKDIDLS